MSVLAVCAYDINIITEQGGAELYVDLIKAHSVTLFSGTEAGIVTTPLGTVNKSILID